MEQTNPQHKAENDVITSFHYPFVFVVLSFPPPLHSTTLPAQKQHEFCIIGIEYFLLLLFGFWRALLLLLLLVFVYECMNF